MSSDDSHRYFKLAPIALAEAYSLEEGMELIRMAFPECIIDQAPALASARRRHRCLVALGVPQEIIDIYRNPKVTRFIITEDWCNGAHLNFDLWDRQAISAYPSPGERNFDACHALAQKLSRILGYTCAVSEHD